MRALGVPFGDRVGGDQLTAQLELDIAALGDLERRRERLGPGRERRRHLGGVLEVELVGLEADLGLGERALRLYAQERRVMMVVLATQVVHVGGPSERAAHLASEADDHLVAAILDVEAVALDLEVDVLATERADQLVDVRANL